MIQSNDFDIWNIYLKKEGRIIGLHAMGIKGPYEYTLTHLDGSSKLIKTDFQTFEQWGNEYNDEFNMIGKGSFRVFSLDIEEAAKDFEQDGWVRFEKE